MNSTLPLRRKPRNLALDLVDALGTEIGHGQWPAGQKLPTEAAIMERFGVSRTVVREALSRLQAGGLVETRHGVGTFVRTPGDSPPFRVSPDQLGTLREVIALLEFRISVETEAAALAAARRQPDHLAEMRQALDEFSQAVEAGRDAVSADYRFHGEVARATQNTHFVDLMKSLGLGVIPRARLNNPAPMSAERQAYLRRVNLEHESIYNAIAEQDVEAARAAMRTHLSNSRDRLRRGEAAQN
ncbi:MAG: FadR/GntR family transcriptional regulator [Betaproteobacteria bacterium]